MRWTRRRALHAAGLCAAAVAAGGWTRPALGDVSGTRRLSLHNLHTGERADVEFHRDGRYVEESIAAIRTLLRDFRTGEEHVIDPKLLEYAYDLAAELCAEPRYDVISGYRSPQTNEALRERSSGVARHSMHVQGRAMDVRLAGVDCAELATRAQRLARGGVGYYARSNFVHIDTGAFRTWRG